MKEFMDECQHQLDYIKRKHEAGALSMTQVFDYMRNMVSFFHESQEALTAAYIQELESERTAVIRQISALRKRHKNVDKLLNGLKEDQSEMKGGLNVVRLGAPPGIATVPPDDDVSSDGDDPTQD